MITKEIGINAVVPGHYIENYPRFMNFMNAYFSFLYRERGGMTEAELNDVITRLGREAAIAQNAKGGLAYTTDEVYSGSFLERKFEPFMSKDGLLFQGSDERQIEASLNNKEYIDRWYDDMGFVKERVTPVEGNKMTFLDDIRIIKMMKALFEIRGGIKAMELFFSIFFDPAAITISYPREKISVIDNNFIPDGDTVPRDDDYYSEFSYVVHVNHAPIDHQDLIVNFYKQYFHPAGFKLFVENATT